MDKEFIYKLEISNLSQLEEDLCAAYLNEYGVEAIEDLNEGIGIYHPSKEYLKGAKKHLIEKMALSDSNFSITDIESKNWNAEWESSFEPIVIDDFCVIKASHHREQFEANHILRIDPQLAFGTGHHETTFQMIQTMRYMDFDGNKVLDYGCGTAVLAILAERLGASSIDAIDNDPNAVQCAEDCVRLNNSESVRVKLATLDQFDVEDYDIILANINRNVLLETAETLTLKLRNGGHLLLSGILNEDVALITQTYAGHNFKVVRQSSKGNWSCLLLRVE